MFVTFDARYLKQHRRCLERRIAVFRFVAGLVLARGRSFHEEPTHRHCPESKTTVMAVDEPPSGDSRRANTASESMVGIVFSARVLSLPIKCSQTSCSFPFEARAKRHASLAAVGDASGTRRRRRSHAREGQEDLSVAFILFLFDELAG